ncbi:MAG: 1-acyl-sn-glycerol-3-phosphate acyltransferase [Calditrichaeota bacterium]|nr:1-acyl-sn-glycerol-3-phosphate acyltransferase [Calditrichota bacterium]
MGDLISIILYVIGGISFFFVGITVIALTYMLKPHQYDSFVKWLCRAFLRTMFIRVETIGKQKIDPQKTYIFMSNHVNIFDAFVLNGSIPNFARGVELEKHFDWPIWGHVITKFGNIPISQTKFLSAAKSLEKAEQAIKDGTSIIILPEGHRTRNGKLLPFMRGPFLLALRAKADIVPMAMIGSFEIKKVKQSRIRPGKIKVVFGDAIRYEDFHHLNSKQLKEHVRQEMQKLIDSFSAKDR